MVVEELDLEIWIVGLFKWNFGDVLLRFVEMRSG